MASTQLRGSQILDSTIDTADVTNLAITNAKIANSTIATTKLAFTPLLADGTQALTANWDAGNWQIRATQFYADATTGTTTFLGDVDIATNLKVLNIGGGGGVAKFQQWFDGTHAKVHNYHHGGNWELELENASGTQYSALIVDPDAKTLTTASGWTYQVSGGVTKKVSMGLLFPDGGNTTSDGSPRWTELATPGSISVLRINSSGSGVSYFRAATRVPNDWKSGTSITVKILWGARNSSNNATSDYVSLKRYIDARGAGDAPGGLGASWGILSGSTTWITAGSGNVLTEDTVYTISSGSLAAGDIISCAFQVGSINSGNNILVADVLISYTAYG